MAFSIDEQRLCYDWLARDRVVKDLMDIVSIAGLNAQATEKQLDAADHALGELPAADTARGDAWRRLMKALGAPMPRR
jgi:hypothetical protein